MKSYLLFFMFALGILCLPISIFAQEDSSTSSPSNSSATTQSVDDSPLSIDNSSPVEHQRNSEELPNYPEGEMPGVGAERAPKESDTFQTKFFNMLFLLALLIGFMILASWALKRMMKSKMTQLNTASHIKVLETRYLSPRATLYLVEVYNQSILIAESPHAISYLATLPIEGNHFSENTPSFSDHRSPSPRS